MARTEITTFLAAGSKGVASYVPGAPDQVNGNSFKNNGKRFALLENSNAATRDITVRMPSKVDGNLTVADRTVTIPATTGRAEIGPFPPEYTQPDGMVYIDYSASAGLTVSWWELP